SLGACTDETSRCSCLRSTGCRSELLASQQVSSKALSRESCTDLAPPRADRGASGRMSDMSTAGMPADLVCLSVAGTRIPLPVLEALSFTQDELSDSLVDLKLRTGASQVCLLSTCERTEVYAALPGGQDPSVLVEALAANRGVPSGVVHEVSTTLT